MTEETENTEEKSRVYWFFHNLKTRIKGGFKSWIKKHPIWFTLIVLCLLYLIVVDRSAIQPVILLIRKYLVLVVFILLILWLYKRYIKDHGWKRNIPATIVLIVFLGLSWFFGPSVHNYFSLYVHYSQMKKIEISEMPVSGNERIQPINSIRTLIKQEALNETEDATDPQFIRGKDGKFYFTACVGPSKEYKIQQFTKDMYEVLMIPAYLPSPVFSAKYRADVKFNIGENLLFSKDTENAVIKRFGFSQFLSYETSEPIYLQDSEGKWLQVVPIVKWKGFLFPRPVFGGVFIVEQESNADNYFKRVFLGKGKYYSPEDVLKSSFLKGQNLQPAEVVTFIAQSFKFANGFLAPMPGYHEGDVRIPVLSNDQNSMPYVTYFDIKGEGKLYNYFGLEPYQEDKKGLSLSLFVSGDTDQEVYFINHRTEKFIGSSAVPSKIIESKKNYDWSVNYAAESRPYVREVDGKKRFFWLSTIVSKAGEGQGDYIGGSIPELCLTDARYGKVVWVNPDSLANLNSWVRQAEGELEYYWQDE